jgi:small-conductance mechanosensitive channel
MVRVTDYLLNVRKKIFSMNTLRLLLIMFLCLSIWTTPARSWDPSELPAGFTVAEEGYPVQLEGKTILTVRVNHKKYPAPQRAEKFSAEILKLARDPLFDPNTITVQDFDLSSDIMAGDTVIMPVWAFEAKVEGRPTEELARDYAEKIRQAISTYKQEHSLSNFLIGIAKTLAAFLILVVLIILVNRGGRRLHQVIQATSKIHSVRFGEVEFLTTDRIKALINSAVKAVRLLIILFLFYVYLHLGLSFFPTTKQFALNFYHNLINALGIIGHAIWEQIPALTFLAVLYVIARYILKSLRFFFDQVASGTLTVAGLDAEVAPITYRIFRILIIIFFLVIAYPYIPGSDSPAFKGISIFLGVLFSFGSSSAVANLLAGVALTYQRSYRVGDVIKVGDIVGVVLERKLNVTRINTWKNQIVTMSNNTVSSGYVTNFSQKVREGNGVILHTSITIGYDAPWRTVYALLIEAARSTRHILPSPAPFVFQSSLNDFYVSYELNAYTDSPENMLSIYSELHENIQDKFNEGGVEIMSPHYSNLRDGNQTTIPADYLPPDYIAPGLRIANVGNPVKK